MEAPIFFTPGEQIKRFAIEKEISHQDAKGRITYSECVPGGYIEGTISQAKQRQKHEWNQMGHPISHTIVVHGGCTVEAMRVLVDEEDRRFEVQGVDDPSGLDIFHIIYCMHKRE